MNSSVISEQDLQNQCTDYRNESTESSAWTASLFLMSWILYNLKMKTQNRHCGSTAHGHGPKEPKCKKGSAFHNDLYMKCFKSFNDISMNLKKNPTAFSNRVYNKKFRIWDHPKGWI